MRLRMLLMEIGALCWDLFIKFYFQFNLLLSNLLNMKEFAWNWLELGEKIGHMVEEGETELWSIFFLLGTLRLRLHQL